MKELTKIIMYVAILGCILLSSCHGPWIDSGCIVTSTSNISKGYTQYECYPFGDKGNGYGSLQFKDRVGKFQVGDTLYMSKTKQP